MKTNAGILLSVALALAGRTALFAGDEKSVPDYYPLKVGTKWQYDHTEGGTKTSVTHTITKSETFDGKELFRLESTMGDKVLATEHLTVTDKGVFRHRIGEHAIDPPVCLLKFPVKEDETWGSDVKVGDEKVTFSARAGKEEEVTVPAGKYKAVSCELEIKSAKTNGKTRYWFAKGVGVVKQTVAMKAENGEMNIDLELTKFEPAK